MLFEAFIVLSFAPAGNTQKKCCKINQDIFSGTPKQRQGEATTMLSVTAGVLELCYLTLELLVKSHAEFGWQPWAVPSMWGIEKLDVALWGIQMCLFGAWMISQSRSCGVTGATGEAAKWLCASVPHQLVLPFPMGTCRHCCWSCCQIRAFHQKYLSSGLLWEIVWIMDFLICGPLFCTFSLRHDGVGDGWRRTYPINA